MPASNLIMYLFNLIASILIVVGLVLTIHGASKKHKMAQKQ